MKNSEIAEYAFSELPHVNEVWVTSDGHYHLHPHKGGELFTRGAVVESTTQEESKVIKTKKK